MRFQSSLSSLISEDFRVLLAFPSDCSVFSHSAGEYANIAIARKSRREPEIFHSWSVL